MFSHRTMFVMSKLTFVPGHGCHGEPGNVAMAKPWHAEA